MSWLADMMLRRLITVLYRADGPGTRFGEATDAWPRARIEIASMTMRASSCGKFAAGSGDCSLTRAAMSKPLRPPPRRRGLSRLCRATRTSLPRQ
jgi:hypothetical protein